MKWVIGIISVLILIFVVIRILVNSLFTRKIIDILLLVLGILVAGIILFSSFSKDTLELNIKLQQEVDDWNLMTLFSEPGNGNSSSTVKSTMEFPDQSLGMFPGKQFTNKALLSGKLLSIDY